MVLSQSEENQLINSKKKLEIHHHPCPRIPLPTHARTHARLSLIGGDENKVKATEPCMCDTQKKISLTVSAPL